MKNKHLLCLRYNVKSLKTPRRIKLFTENHATLKVQDDERGIQLNYI